MWFEFYRYGSLFIYDQNLILYSRICPRHSDIIRRADWRLTSKHISTLTASLLIHFLKSCFILYTISDKVVYLLCVYSISCQIQLNFDDGHNLHQRRFCPCFLWDSDNCGGGNMIRSLHTRTRLWLACTDWWLLRRWKMKWPVTARRGREPRY